MARARRTIRWRLPPRRSPLLLLAGWLVLTATLAWRPLMPIDETRCVSVAWEMYQSGDYFLPRLNGEPYTHKPPFLYWLIILGWRLGGVTAWWPRLLPPLFSLGTLLLTARLARRLWPSESHAAGAAPLLLLGTALWAFFTTVLLYEMVMIFFVLLALLCYIAAWRTGRLFAWLAAAAALGTAMLAKGAVALIPAAGVLLLLPWCVPAPGRQRLHRWYGGVVASGALALLIGFSWLGAAAVRQGGGFLWASLHDQYLGRVVHSFDHPHPCWWYLALLPAALFPWSGHLGWWRHWRNLRLADGGSRLCLAWIVPSLVVFSLISGKQLYYLLCLLPAFALLAAHLWQPAAGRRWDTLPAAAVIALAGVALLVLPTQAGSFGIPRALGNLDPAAGLLVLVIAVLLLYGGSTRCGVAAVAGAVVAILAVTVCLVFAPLRPAYDLRPTARLLAQCEREGRPLAHAGKYYGEYHFLGRLSRPFAVVTPSGVAAWLAAHPGGRAVIITRNPAALAAAGYSLEHLQPYGSRYAAVVKEAH